MTGFAFDHVEPSLDVSIVVPVWNEIRHIDACLDSIQAQELGPLTSEVLLVDGGSTDGTRERIAARSAARPGVRLIENPGRKVSLALNAGMRASRGRIIVRMDAHALYAPDYVRGGVAVLESSGASAVGGAQVAMPGAETAEARAIAAAQRTLLGLGGARHRRPEYEGPAEAVPYGIFRRELIARIGGFDEDLYRTEDNDFFQRIRAAGGTLWLSTRIRARYLCRATLGALFRQQYATGTELVPTMARNPRALSPRHLGPGLAALTAIVLGIAAVAGPPALASFAWWSLVGGVGAYALLVLATSLRITRREGLALLPYLVATYPALHLAYALGTIVGAAKTPYRIATRRARAQSLGLAA